MSYDPKSEPSPPESEGRGRHSHSLMMVACCIPMLVIAVALVATGVASPSFLLVAVMCTAMMVMMMRGMSGDHDTH